MIVGIEGIVHAKSPGYVVLRTAGGLAYGVEVPEETERMLPAEGGPVHLYTHLVIREDQWRLIGFATEHERSVFLDLIAVNGVGIKGALSVMSALGVAALERAVEAGNWKALTEAPGIGAKIAQRIQLELKTRWARHRPGGHGHLEEESPLVRQEDDVVLALQALGYQGREVEAVLAQLPQGTPEERLRQALRALDRGRSR
ncbi:MAG: Holliday junction branch migration protein RuvA [Firmicutes bacterium]|nr:Holliday junction branch migration protein RuvA [Bacillota bacterium]